MTEQDKQSKTKIKNDMYRQFLDQGIITTLNVNDIKKLLEKVKHKQQKMARSLIIAMYYTGARPNEILQLKSSDFEMEGVNIKIQLKGSKGGLPRPIYINKKHELASELFNYSQTMFPGISIFYKFVSKYVRTVKTRKGNTKLRKETTALIYYYFRKWFKSTDIDITPYFLRHNRFSKLAEKGASMEQLRQTKGSKTFDSVYPYLHMSAYNAKKTSKIND